MLSALGCWPAGQFTAIDRVFIDTGVHAVLSALGGWPAGQFTAIDRVFIDTKVGYMLCCQLWDVGQQDSSLQ